MPTISYHTGRRGFLGFLTYITGGDSVSRGGVIPAFVQVDSAGVAAGAGTPASPTRVLPATNAGVTKSGSITVGGTAQVLAAANANRSYLKVQNTSAADLTLNEVGGNAAIAGTADSYVLGPRGIASINTNEAVSVWGATTGQTWSATEG